MKRKILLTLGALILAAVSACAVNASRQNPPQSRSVQSGSRDQVAFFYNLTTECQPAGVPQITVTKAPANGTVTIGSGPHQPQYPADNPRSACNQQSVASAEVYYQSAPNFHGGDDFAIQVSYSSTFNESYSYAVTVN
jgi:hypothetical protein